MHSTEHHIGSELPGIHGKKKKKDESGGYINDIAKQREAD